MTLEDLVNKLNKLENDLNNIINDNQFKNETNKVVDVVRTRTRAGYGVKSPNSARKPLKELSTFTKAKKRSEGKSTRSRLTHTGEMLDSVKPRKISVANKVVIEPTGKKNKEKARKNSKDRPFLNLSKEEVKNFVKGVSDVVTNKIKKLF